MRALVQAYTDYLGLSSGEPANFRLRGLVLCVAGWAFCGATVVDQTWRIGDFSHALTLSDFASVGVMLCLVHLLGVLRDPESLGAAATVVLLGSAVNGTLADVAGGQMVDFRDSLYFIAPLLAGLTCGVRGALVAGIASALALGFAADARDLPAMAITGAILGVGCVTAITAITASTIFPGLGAPWTSAEPSPAGDGAHPVRMAILGALGQSLIAPVGRLQTGIAHLEVTALDRHQWLLLEAIKTSSHGLAELVDEMLELSRIGTTDFGLQREVFDWRALLREVCDAARSKATAKGVAIHIDLEDDAPERLVGDGRRIKQVLASLIADALERTEYGSIWIGFAASPTGVAGMLAQFTVADTSAGMPQASARRLLDPFGMALQEEGSRLRLTIPVCRSIATAMGGALNIVTGEGDGVTFYLTVPLSSTANETPSEKGVAAYRHIA